MFTLVFIGLAVAMAIAIGILVASNLKGDQRKIVGGLAILVGVVLVVFGIGMNGTRDVNAIMPSGFGALVLIVGIVVIFKGTTQGAARTFTTKRCPFCAETIQSEAMLCRFCDKTLEMSADGTQ